MEYAVALAVYLASIFGVFYSMYAMVAFRRDARLVGFFALCSIVFCFTMFLGGTMLQNIN